MNDERRRYFRIDETVGISYHVLDGDEKANAEISAAPDVMSLVSEQDQHIERLLLEIADDHPAVAQLVTIFNQKLERIVSQMMLESHLVGRIAHKVKEANISACGIGFLNDEPVSAGARLKMELSLFPTEKKLITNGIVVACDDQEEGQWYWRIDFYGMSPKNQEALIQHVVKCQSMQIKNLRENQ